MWKNLLVFGLVVRVDEAAAIKELRHDVGLEGHVEGGACLLALKQVRVVAHLQTSRRGQCIRKNRQKNQQYSCLF